MAGAYAALVSLLNTVDQIQSDPLLSTSFSNHPNKSLREKIDFLVGFVENYSDADSYGEAEDLLRRIAVVAHVAGDIIEVHAARAVLAHRIRVVAFSQHSHTFLLELRRIRVDASTQQSLQRTIDDMDSIKEQILKMKEETGNRQLTSSSSPPATAMVESNSEAEDLVRPMAVVALEADEETGSINHQQPASSSSSAKTTNMVGFDGYLEQLLDQLTRQTSRRKILPIIGMGGIGKTTLARNVYDNSLVVEHFHVRAWATVSQEFNVSEILLQILSCLGKSTSTTDEMSDGELRKELHTVLYGERYLIVLDDVWSVEAWDKIKFSFPENNNGSRIVITTRQTELVGYFGSSALSLDFLDDKNSWELFCEKTFPQQNCPPELVEIGKKIVVKCKGLPLAIVVVGGFLGKSPRTLEYWEEITKDKSLILDSGEGNNASGILYLSYKHLPVRFKSCFLYMGLFPEDYVIKVSRLIKLWVAEGYIKANTDQSLEEVGENYVNELVDRNLVLVGELRQNKKLKTCFVHDLVRDLCVRIAEKENFYCDLRGIDGKRYFIVDERPEPSISRLLRISILDGMTLDPFREVNLRFITHASSYDPYELPPSVSLLWSLQTLIITGYVSVTAPCEIWEMPQLRHINVSPSLRLPHPPPPGDDSLSVLQNLHTLSTVENLTVTEEVCKRIPNIKKLGIIYNANAQGEEASSCSYHLHNAGCFNKLESLRCSGNGYKCASGFFRDLKLPSSLKKLTLEKCKLVWSDMGMIASLPNLQILNLLTDAVVGAEWDCVEVEFVCLKHLKIHDADLIYWSADNSNFPELESLSLKYLSKLEEIPLGIGEVPTLEKIQTYECSKSANFSAVKMLEEQESQGNLSLQLEIIFTYKSAAEKLWEEIKELDITCQNLRIYNNVEAWEQVMRFFPENNIGSRIVITTRHSKLVGYFGSSALAVDFLDDKNSWDLFCEKTFPQQNFPPEFVEIGKKIVVKCKGFPLAIVVVGGFLKNSSATLEYWEKVSKDKSLVLHSRQGNNASDILYLSYKQLPIWLKPCFLYFGLFPEDYPIKVSRLIKLWVAEGFIKSNSDQSLEEIAENYVNELVDRNLVLVGSLRLNKKLKICLVHDLVRDLCLRIAEKENFYCVQRDIDGKRHFIVDERTARFYHTESHHTPSLVHPLILDGPRELPYNSRLLRVWFSDGKSPYCHYLEGNLRLLINESTHKIGIPPSVSLLWCLQTLIVTSYRGAAQAPCEIWDMPQLRHIDISHVVHLPHPPPSDDVVLHNLKTLATLEASTDLPKVCKRIPNIKKLGIRINMQFMENRNRIHSVGFLNKLESLRCYCFGYVGDPFQNLNLPSSLKKLTLKDSRLEWRDMGMIGSLPHLQILKLLDNAVIGAEWNCVEGEFVCLKHLEIRRCGQLISWIADSSNFPVLETLSFYSLSKLEEIPSDIGNVATLEKISLFSCSYSAALSAVRILEEQENLGYMGLQVRTMFYSKSEARKLRKEIEELAITSPNLLIYGAR